MEMTLIPHSGKLVRRVSMIRGLIRLSLMLLVSLEYLSLRRFLVLLIQLIWNKELKRQLSVGLNVDKVYLNLYLNVYWRASATLQLCSFPHTELRRATIPIFFDMIQCEYAISENFASVSPQYSHGMVHKRFLPVSFTCNITCRNPFHALGHLEQAKTNAVCTNTCG